MRIKPANAIASGVGLVLLVGIVTLAAHLFSPGQHFWVTAIAGYLFTVPLAIAAWNGALSKHDKSETQGTTTWQDWIGLFFVGLVFSAVFVAIDLGVAHPGISIVFTIVAVSLSLVALPSAIRAWVLQLLSNRRSGQDE